MPSPSCPNMYQCPLCTSSTSNYYATLDSLSSHIDVVHCLITGPTRYSNDIKVLENQINSFINLELKQSERNVQRKHFSNTFVNSSDQQNFSFDTIDHRTKLVKQNDMLLNFPKDYEYVKLENDYLKQRLRDLERSWKNENEKQEEKSFHLQKDLQNVTSFVQDSQREQQKSKQQLQRFLSDLLSDLEQKEKTIFELSEQAREKNEEQYITSLENPLNVSGTTNNLSQVPIRTSIRTRKPSGQSVDSGYYDGMDSVLKRPPSFNISQTKSAQYRDSDTLDHPGHHHDLAGSSPEQQKVYSASESVLGRVFAYLDTMTLLKCATVCRKWKKVAEHPLFWRRIYIKNVEMTPKRMKKLSSYCEQTNGITLIQLQVNEDTLIKLKKGILEQSLESIFKACGEFLTFLKIVDCCPYLTDRCLWLASCHCRNLKQIIYVSQLYPVGAPVLWSMGASCRKIETLIFPLSKNRRIDNNIRIGNDLRFDDNCLLMIARCWPISLKRLSVAGHNITISGLAQIVEHCEILESFEIENFPELTLINAQHITRRGWKFLQQLHLCQTKISCQAVLWFCVNLPRLSTILINWKTNPSEQNGDSYLSEIFELQKLKEADPSVDRIVRIVLQR